MNEWEYNIMARGQFDWDDDDDLDSDDRQRTEVPDLRKAYNALKRQYKELESKYTDASKGLRERSVKDVLAAKGLNEKIAAFIPESVTSPEDVQSWVDQYADVFGSPAPANDAPPAPATSPELEALARIASSQSSGATYSGDADQMAALIAATQNPAELNKVLYGNSSGPQAI